MADASIDVLMRVVGQKGVLDAESMTIVPADADKLATDFLPDKFCELKEFSFSAGVASAMSKKQKDETIDMQPVEFTRTMDCLSLLLFQSLVNCETLNTISIVKRKASGVDLSGLAYLRLDFNGVLMTQLDWKDGEHVITESGTFIYRSVTIRYRPQLANGTLGSIIQQDWKMTSPTA